MSKAGSKFWGWLLQRSPQNADRPDIQQQAFDTVADVGFPAGAQPIEISSETESLVDSPIKLGSVDAASKGSEGQLIRAHNSLVVILGCGHAVKQSQAADDDERHIRGIAGRCPYCFAEIEELIAKGKVEIMPFDAERLSLVCSDCGKITTSGFLCCPRHYKDVPNPDGTVTYLGPEDAEEQARQNTAKAILSALGSLVSEDNHNTPRENTQEQNNDQKSN